MASENYCQGGHINLCGIKAKNENENKMIVEGYVNIELDANVPANMLKQPLAKEIRTFIQKMACSIQNTD